MKNANDIPSPEKMATDWDHRIIDSFSEAMGGTLGRSDDVERLYFAHIGSSELTPYEIAIAFARWAQDLKKERKELRELVETLRK